jgi:hypothetical protein
VYTHAIGRIVGFSWLAVGLILYTIYRSFLKKSATEWTGERKK